MNIEYHHRYKTCYIADDLTQEQVFKVCDYYGIDPCLHFIEFKTHPEFKENTFEEIENLWIEFKKKSYDCKQPAVGSTARD